MDRQKYIFLVLLFLFLFNCTSYIKKDMKSQTVKVIIGFYNWNDNGERIEDTIFVYTDKQKINKLIDGISNIHARFYKCGYDGYISFYKNDKEIFNKGRFNLYKDCNHIVLGYGNIFISRKLSNDLKEFLLSLKNKN